ncbi:MAG: epoxyqueuosine reductase QueH [Erysipelotrichaceae bacterium]|nr:epoxyqueuosine reductase QueH [Erysipelotrichaceae bacterium]
MNNLQKHYKQISELKGRPELLIHICCGVCSVYPLVYLSRYFKITVFFSNSNIYPYEEFERRLEALKAYLLHLDDPEINLIVDTYDNEGYTKKLAEFKDEPEGGKRCRLCYRLRMEETFRYACKHRYAYCTTVMSISNRKNADWINEIGEQLQKQYPNTTYLYADFKKDDGITRNEKMNKELGLYHQNYCGCIYSLTERNNG